MSERIISEAFFYLSSFLWGMTLVAIYDVFRIIRRIVKHRNGWVAIEDIFFWVAAAVIVFRMIYQYNNGTIRLPGMVILILGMGCYHFGISDPFINFLNHKIILPSKKMIRVSFRGLKNLLKKVKMNLSIKTKREKSD